MGIAYNPRIVTDGLVLCLDAANPKSYPGTGTTWFDISGKSRNLTIYGSPTFNSAGYFTLGNNQTTQYMMRYPFETPTENITYSCWFRSNFTSTFQTPFTYSVNGDNQMLFFANSNTKLTPHPLGVAIDINTSNMTNIWVNFSWSRQASSGLNLFYRDGVQVGSYSASAGVNIASNGYLIIGQEADAPGGAFDSSQNLDGDFARLDIYDRILTAEQIRQNFNATRGRYGI